MARREKDRDQARRRKRKKEVRKLRARAFCLPPERWRVPRRPKRKR